MNALGESTLVTDYIPPPPAEGGIGARGVVDRDRNRPTDREPTATLPTNGLHIPARVGGLDATADDVDDEVLARGYSRRKSSDALEPGGGEAASSDGTDLHSLEQLTGPQQRCLGPRGWSQWSEPWSIQYIGCQSA